MKKQRREGKKQQKSWFCFATIKPVGNPWYNLNFSPVFDFLTSNSGCLLVIYPISSFDVWKSWFFPLYFNVLVHRRHHSPLSLCSHPLLKFFARIVYFICGLLVTFRRHWNFKGLENWINRLFSFLDCQLKISPGT